MDLIDQTKNQGRQRRTILKEKWLQINEKRKVASMQLQTQWRDGESFKLKGNPSLNEVINLSINLRGSSSCNNWNCVKTFSGGCELAASNPTTALWVIICLSPTQSPPGCFIHIKTPIILSGIGP